MLGGSAKAVDVRNGFRKLGGIREAPVRISAETREPRFFGVINLEKAETRENEKAPKEAPRTSRLLKPEYAKGRRAAVRK